MHIFPISEGAFSYAFVAYSTSRNAFRIVSSLEAFNLCVLFLRGENFFPHLQSFTAIRSVFVRMHRTNVLNYVQVEKYLLYKWTFKVLFKQDTTGCVIAELTETYMEEKLESSSLTKIVLLDHSLKHNCILRPNNDLDFEEICCFQYWFTVFGTFPQEGSFLKATKLVENYIQTASCIIDAHPQNATKTLRFV